MSSPAASPVPAHLAEKQREALISLLADEDPAIYALVRAKLLAYGEAAVRWLRPHTLSNDPVLRRRAVALVQHLLRQEADQRFLAFCQRAGEDLDLEEAAGLLAKTQYPETNIEAYQALFDHWADEARARLPAGAEPETILGTINRLLFGDLGFKGDPEYGVRPDSSYLNRVVDERRGSPISLCAVYLFVARRLRLPITGIGLPGHFVCRYQSSRKEIYIDAYQQGRFLSKADCVKYLLQHYHGLQDGALTVVTRRRMLLRLCAHLHQTYSLLEQAQAAARLHRYVLALTR